MTVFVVELESSRVLAILPPLSDADEALQDSVTVGVLLELPLIVKFLSLSSRFVGVVFDCTRTL